MKAFQSILVGIEAEQPNAGVLAQAAWLGEKFGARIKLLDTVREFSWLTRTFTPQHDQLMNLLQEEKREKLEAICVELGSTGLDVSYTCEIGKQSDALIADVKQHNHDLVLRVAKGRTSRRAGQIGTTASRLLRNCPCSIWLTRQHQAGAAKRVLAAVDATPEDEDHGRLNSRILQTAAQVVETPATDLHVVFAWEVFGEEILRAKMPEEDFAELQSSFCDRNAASFGELLQRETVNLPADHAYLEHGDPVEIIPRLIAQHEIDLLMLGTVARTGMPGLFLGNTAELLVDKIECALLTIRPAAK